MPEVRIDGRAHGVSVDEAFRIVRQFERYPELAPETVKGVVVQRESDDTLRCEWVVYFRSGLLRWSEIDVIDDAAKTIHFHQLDGDFEVFEGGWNVEQADDGTIHLVFAARFDFGVPSLEAIVNPVACRVLVETMERITFELFDGHVVFDHELGIERRIDQRVNPSQ
jgi:ribosome-associated toxin RatA of RatAB toxin-antitoxin module